MSEPANPPPEPPDANPSNGAFSEGEPPLPPPRGPASKKNNVWLYYFAFLIIASIGVAAFVIWWNWRQQLTPEKLEVAEKLWNEKGPKSYKMVYTKEIRGEKRTTFAVTVHDKKVTEVIMDGALLTKRPDQTDDPRIYHSMEAQFLFIRRFMDLDAKPDAPPVYCVASFDPHTGAVMKYVRTEQKTEKRVELLFQPVEALKD